MPGNGAAAGASYGDLLITSLLVLGAVCIAAFIAVRVFGRLLATGRARGQHLMDVVARVPLEPRRSLYVVEVAGKTLLVGTSEMGLSVLTELDAGEVRSRVEARPTFGELVRKAWLGRKSASARAGADASPDSKLEPSSAIAASTTEPPPAATSAASAASAASIAPPPASIAAASSAPELTDVEGLKRPPSDPA